MSLFGSTASSNTTQSPTSVSSDNSNAGKALNFNSGGIKKSTLNVSNSNTLIDKSIKIGDKPIDQFYQTERESNVGVDSSGVQGSFLSLIGITEGKTPWLIAAIVLFWLWNSGRSS